MLERACGFESHPGHKLSFNLMKFLLDIFSKVPVTVLLLISALFVIAGDFFAKYWSVHRGWLLFVIAFITYSLSGFFYIPTLLREGLVVTALMWTLLATIGFVLIGLLIFKESLTPLQIIGVITGIISLMILNI